MNRFFPAALRSLTRAGLLMMIGLAAGTAAQAAAGAGTVAGAAGAAATYAQECASCHTAYPPGMLPARSWERVMNGLDKHFGTDASVDAATVKQLSGWLQANAGTYKRVAEEPPQDRITRSAWFIRKHHEVDPTVWKAASVKSAANCAACHTQADKGNFNERFIKMPAGLTSSQQRAWND
jgi:cytochrome c553